MRVKLSWDTHASITDLLAKAHSIPWDLTKLSWVNHCGRLDHDLSDTDPWTPLAPNLPLGLVVNGTLFYKEGDTLHISEDGHILHSSPNFCYIGQI